MNYYSVSDFYKKIFGSKVYKISLDAGCTCPNRDGTKGTGGCIFCSSQGSGEFSADRNLSITEQVQAAKKLVDSKFSRKVNHGQIVPKKYLAYFQNFTSTYGDSNLLVKKYKEALSCENVVGLCIGTRPDCIKDDLLERLAQIAEEKYVQIEFGLQTASEKTGKYINRCFSNEDYIDAVSRIHSANKKIHVVTHLIFGLPGETKETMMNSVDFAVQTKTDGIKITNLFVIKGTKLYEDYINDKNGFIHILEMDEYFGLLKSALERIGNDIVIHRLTGDGPKKILESPVWTMDKKNVLNRLKDFLSSY